MACTLPDTAKLTDDEMESPAVIVLEAEMADLLKILPAAFTRKFWSPAVSILEAYISIEEEIFPTTLRLVS